MADETAADIAADLVVLRAARTKMATGEMVQEVARAGRRLVNGLPTLPQIIALIQQREQDYEAAVAAEEGRPRRSAIGFTFG